MKRSTLILWGALLSAAIALGVPHVQGAPPPAQSQPAGPEARKPRAIWDYQKELGLSQEQVDKIKAAVETLKKDLTPLREKLVANERELRELLVKNADLVRIKAKLQESAKIQVELRYTDIVVGRTIHEILTQEQADKWREIQRQSRPERGGAAPAPSR